MNKINILYVIGNPLDYGGISTFVMSYYREIHGEDIHIDFLVYGYGKGIYDDEISNKHSQIFHVPIRSKHPLRHRKEIKIIIKSKQYDIIHAHVDAMNGYVLDLAKKAHIKVRMSHAHNTAHLTSHPVKKIILNHYKKKITKVATNFLACSKDAASFMYPKINKKNIKHIYNATDLMQFTFDQKKRNMIRDYHHVSKKTLLIGHIGRFDDQKNHMFLIELVNEMKHQEKNVKLICIGNGHLKHSFIDAIKKNKLEFYIEVIEPIPDIEKYYSAFDVFILPSLFEGFGYVLIEAQYNGLNCVSSSHVPIETNITKDNLYISLNAPLRDWIDQIESAARNRKIMMDISLFKNFHIENAAQVLKNNYQESMNR